MPRPQLQVAAACLCLSAAAIARAQPAASFTPAAPVAVGRVYPIDPLHPLEERELPRLVPGPPLAGPGFGIEDELYPPALPVAPGDFRFMPNDPSFDQVNLYWHVDHYLHDFMEPLGYRGLPDSLILRLHSDSGSEPAHTDGSYVWFQRPIPGFSRESSRAADIVYHELGHAVIYGFGIQPGGIEGKGNEAGALHEGLADYFSAAFTGDPAIGEWLYINFPNGATRVDQPAPMWDYAHYGRVAFGPDGPGGAHANGMILSSGLWELRRQLGRTCDSLVLESLAYLHGTPSWADFENALFHADRDHHGGRYWRTIGDVLRRRLIRGAITAAISGPTQVSPGEPAKFRALDCCGGTPGRYHWRVRGWCRGTPYGPWRDLGDDDSLLTSFLGDSDLELSVQSPFGDTASVLEFVSVSTPSLEFTGPTRVAKGAVGTWSLRVVGAVPWGLSVFRQWRSAGRAEDTLGSTTNCTFAATGPFRLRASLTDREGRTATAQIEVETFTDRPPRDADVFVHVQQLVEAGRRAEVHVFVAEATTVRMGIYDIRGRERLLLEDGSAPRGERTYWWDTNVLEPGIYFLRAATTSGHADQLRFIVIR